MAPAHLPASCSCQHCKACPVHLAQRHRCNKVTSLSLWAPLLVTAGVLLYNKAKQQQREGHAEPGLGHHLLPRMAALSCCSPRTPATPLSPKAMGALHHTPFADGEPLLPSPRGWTAGCGTTWLYGSQSLWEARWAAFPAFSGAVRTGRNLNLVGEHSCH